jgi:short-subunit dehydrogenase
MKKYFNDKVIWITGSSKGIGKATAVFLGNLGAKICLNGRNKDSLKSCYKELQDFGIDCIQVAGDVSDSSQCKLMLKEILDHYGRIDILINNAGIATWGRFLELEPDTWDKVLGINTFGSIYPSQIAVPHLLKTNGSLVFISSIAGKVGLPGHSTYSVSKMALTSLAKALQIEFKRELHVGIVYVGFTENEPDKQTLAPDGKYNKLGSRDNLKTAKREDVARSIARLIYKKKKSVTLSFIGKIQGVALRFFPFLITFLLTRVYKDYDKTYRSS